MLGRNNKERAPLAKAVVQPLRSLGNPNCKPFITVVGTSLYTEFDSLGSIDLTARLTVECPSRVTVAVYNPITLCAPSTLSHASPVRKQMIYANLE